MKENEMIHTGRVLIVEGKYDAVRLAHLTDAMILLTDGFGIYKDKKRQQLLKALAKKNGLILFTDSDAAGFRIRTYITGLVGAENVVQAYVPAIHGKENILDDPYYNPNLTRDREDFSESDDLRRLKEGRVTVRFRGGTLQ